MLTRRALVGFCVAVGVAMTVHIPSVSAGAGGEVRFAVVAGKDFPVNEMSFGDLKRLYMGQPLVQGGTNVVPVALSRQHPDRIAFDEAVLGMGPETVGLYWVDRKIRGQTGQPRAVDSADVVMRVVSRVPGAVGYVRSNAVKGRVKVLRIDGKTPEQPGYRVAK